MSRTSLIWTIVILVIIGAGFYYWSTRTPAPESASAGTPSSTASTDTSDAALDQDTAAIDTELSGLDADNAQVSQSLDDQAVTQSY